MSYLSTDEAYDYNTLACWYQNSVDESPPVWTDEHLEELLQDFYIIPKDTPAADVVPKSEVEKLYKEIDRLSQVVLYHDSFKADEIRDAKADVAREIFEEIEEIFKKRIAFYTDMAKQSKFTEKHYAETMIKNCEIYLQEIAELKKKYTE